MAAGAARGERRRRSRPQGRDGGLAVARVPRPAREPVARAARRVPAARGVRRALRPDRGDRRHERAERPPARRAGAPPRRGAAPSVRGLARAARGARDPLLRGRRGGRSPRAGGAAGPRRRLPRRRRRQGARRRTCGPRPRQGGAPADRGAARPRPPRRLHHAPRGGQRPTGCAVPRPRGQADRRDDPRRRGGPDPGRERDRQPGQAAAPGAGGRPARAAARAQPFLRRAPIRSERGMLRCGHWPRTSSAPARSSPRGGRRDRPGVPRHAGAAVRAARPGARVLGDAEDRDAQPGPVLQRTWHGDGRGGGRREGASRVVCASAGNLGQALACSGSRRDLGVTVVAARTANPLKLRQIGAFGADIRLEGRDIEDARVRAREIAEADGAYLVEDSLDLATCEGAATIGLELVRDDPRLDVVLVAVGGGAMASGVGFAVRSLAEDVEVIGIQPVGAPAMALSWRQGTVVETDRMETIADGVAGRCPIPEVLDDLLVLLDDVVLVREDSIKAGMRALYEHAGLVVEPSAALGIAAVLEQPERFAGRHVTTILCGSNVGPADFARWVLEPAMRDAR